MNSLWINYDGIKYKMSIFQTSHMLAYSLAWSKSYSSNMIINFKDTNFPALSVW